MEIFQFFLLAGGAALLGLAVVAVLFTKIRSIIIDNSRAQEIAAAIRGGAMTFLREEYQIIAIVVAIVTATFFFIYLQISLILHCLLLVLVLVPAWWHFLHVWAVVFILNLLMWVLIS